MEESNRLLLYDPIEIINKYYYSNGRVNIGYTTLKRCQMKKDKWIPLANISDKSEIWAGTSVRL